MARLIDADATYEMARDDDYYSNFHHHRADLGDLYLLLIDATTIEAEPVRHGEWVNVIHAVVDTTGDCSRCGEQAVWRNRNKPYAICPNCGAKMDGGNEVEE